MHCHVEGFADPPPALEVDLLADIRRARAERPRSLVVFDDDPTGTQAVHGVPVLCDWSRETLAAGLAASDTVFVLTNTRSLDARSAAARLRAAVRTVLDVVSEPDAVAFLTRSDSTLRGHVPLETDVVSAELARHGAPVDAVLQCPAFPEAGRVTVGDVQWTRWDGGWRRTDDTPFARDPHFGYRSAHLPSWLEERSAGRIQADEVRTLTLEDIRLGGPARVADILATLRTAAASSPPARPAHDPAHVVANAMDAADLDVVALGVLMAEARGARLVGRVGPSYVRARAGIAPSAPLTTNRLFPNGVLAKHGLVIVGSHVPTTNRQLAALSRLAGLRTVELDVRRIVDAAEAEAEIARAAAIAGDALSTADVVVSTSRDVLPDTGAHTVSRQVSNALVQVLRRLHDHPLRFIVAKGGITASDLATEALELRQATVAGQMLSGLISVWLLPPGSPYPHLPFVLFPGNVGEADTLVEVVSRLREHPPQGTETTTVANTSQSPIR